ncbi:replicative helicase loader/inhibitor [Oceanobacillus halotolerans]|uniref:replicative helicase loader/inhibitor n=1 Tax=Oceanobacillus halotolerans TaxID=2663380 RepID=UPI0013DD6464|nr:replicative helicase loader/inhibitor [Oceanobacillus halotolerans]
MKREEAIDILETVKEMYPKFEVTKRKLNMLIPQLEQMDYRVVMGNLSAYVERNTFAPTIADIAAYPPEENIYLTKIDAWRQEAASVPEETKMRFREELHQLVKEKSGYEA